MARPMGSDGDHRCTDFGNFRAGNNSDNARCAVGHRGIDTIDPRMTVRAADERSMQHMGHGYIVGIAAAAMDQAAHIGPCDWLADKALTVTVWRGHAPAPATARDFAVASTASTIA